MIFKKNIIRKKEAARPDLGPDRFKFPHHKIILMHAVMKKKIHAFEVLQEPGELLQRIPKDQFPSFAQRSGRLSFGTPGLVTTQSLPKINASV